jgi:acetate kinase
MPDNPHILSINGGSSSVKFALFKSGTTLQKVLEGKIESVGSLNAVFTVKSKNYENFSKIVAAPHYLNAATLLIDLLERNSIDLVAAGHRIVHGGLKYHKPELVTVELMENLRLLIPLDPEHLEGEILLIEAFRKKFPHLMQVACFDTAFHQDMPRIAKLLPIPRYLDERGIQRYGFHGLSCEYLMQELIRLEGRDVANSRVILAHLGSGASLTAVSKGRSIDTAMGFTPASGLLMSTRSGDMDPGLPAYLVEHEGFDIKKFTEMVHFKSGLLGISEKSGDIRELLDCENEDIRAKEAVALFCYQIKKTIGAFSAILGGVDALIFSGGIGENSAVIRSRICDGLTFLGVELEEKENTANNKVISAKTSKILVRLIKTDEELMIAKHVSQYGVKI